jgi:membrane dipeptidase
MSITRRTALTLAGGSAIAAAAWQPGIARPEADMLIINTLGFPDDSYAPKAGATAGSDPFISDAGLAAALQSGVTGFNYTISGGTSFAETIAALDAADAYIAAHGDKVVKALSAADILKAKRQGKIAILYGFQNAAMVEKDARNVDVFADRGVRIIQLTYNALNQLGGGSLVPGEVGLTPFGRTVIDRLNARRVIVDLSHSGRAICLDATRTSKQPVCITHTACRAIAETPRNKTDEELRLVADRGGYVGIYFMPFVAPGRAFSSEDVANHIDHAIQVCGEDHVGIGTDHGVTPLGYMAAVRRHYADMVNARRRQGISAPGEDPDLLPFGTDLIGPDQFRTMAATLRKRGYSQTRIEKIMGGNFLRYAGAIWGA